MGMINALINNECIKIYTETDNRGVVPHLGMDSMNWVQSVYEKDFKKLNDLFNEGDLNNLVRYTVLINKRNAEGSTLAQTLLRNSGNSYLESKDFFEKISLGFLIAGTVLVTADRVLKLFKKDNGGLYGTMIGKLNHIENYIKNQKKRKP
jgi:hypothetical protein